MQTVPLEEFNDALVSGETMWLAGTGLWRLEQGNLEAIHPEGRFTALCGEPGGGRIWFAGPRGIQTYPGRGGNPVDVATGYIWDLVWSVDRIWYFGSTGYGWIDATGNGQAHHWARSFDPRPLVFHIPEEDGGGIYVSAAEGLFSIGDSGSERVLPSEAVGGGLISWMIKDGEGFLLGTMGSAYRWSGNAGEVPVVVESNYDKYFSKGISNAVPLTDTVAITDYPYGIAVLNRASGEVDGYSSAESGLEVGDVYKIRGAEGEVVLALGKEGVALTDFGSPHRFFPGRMLWGTENFRGGVAVESGAILITDETWIHVGDDGFVRRQHPGNPYWMTKDPEGRLVMGDVTSYEILEGEAWEDRQLSGPVFELLWGRETGYAVGQDGLYSVSSDLDLDLVYPSEGQLHILGELEGTLYFCRDDGVIAMLRQAGNRWLELRHPGRITGRIRHTVKEGEVIYVSTGAALFRVGPEGAERLNLDPDWEIRGLGSGEGLAFAALYNRSTREVAVAAYGGSGSFMYSVPHMAKIGEPTGVVVSGDRVALVGTGGVGWYAIQELLRVLEPQVTFNLLFENKRIQDRTLPSGMHFIDLQVRFANPEVPARVQYRINEERWRNVNLDDPSLQFGGHGNFTVELRAIHPNGVASKPRLVQFGIAPPWYLNPLYQGVLLVIAIILVWVVYTLRHAQLKRTNLWLKSEVRKQTRELEAATVARTNFLAGLSHDIRNPLNGVLMIAETLSRDPPRSGDDRRLKDLTDFGIIVDRMLGEILDFSAIDQANLPTSSIPVSITDLLDSSIKQNQFNIQREMVNVSMMVPNELREVVIRTDRNWMIKIITNLIVNALEYSGTDRIEVGARYHFLSDQEVDLELYVNDWGCGIDDSEKEFVFDRFYRGESGIESGKHGTGLGLSICQEIAHAMGAHLLLENNEPSGCRFILKGRFERVQGATELDREAVLASLKGRRILVVDDLDYNRKSIVEFFNTIGCECDQCGNGREALEMLGRQSYYLALLDWDLPGLMGPDIAREHRRNHPDDPVILVALTAYTDGEKKKASEKAGMNGYISKPLTASRLAHCLANITRVRPEQQLASDQVDHDELSFEIERHISDCMRFGDHQEWENLRRCAHRLTTLALMEENRRMQQVCRDLQIAAQSGNVAEVLVGLAELRHWRKA